MSRVPMQGSGTFAVEAMIGSFVPKAGKLLMLINGAYGQRICRSPRSPAARPPRSRRRRTRRPISAALERLLADDEAISHVFAVHCETTSGILNPMAEVAAIVARHGRRLLIDAMSAFGALAIDAREVRFDALAASSNKCLEGVPGVGFVICRNEALAECKGNATSLVLDLFDQCRGDGANRPVALHAADPCHRGVRQGDRGARGRGRRCRPRRALSRQLPGS